MKSIFKSILVLLLLKTLPVGAATTVTQVAAGAYHSLFVKSDGTVWAMGNNSSGQLGLGAFSGTNIPQQIGFSGTVTSVAAGGYHSMILRSDGSLWTMGDNSDGDLGDRKVGASGSPEVIVTSGVTSMAAGDAHSLFRETTVSGRTITTSLWGMGYNLMGQLGDGTEGNRNPPELLQSTTSRLLDITAIAAGGDHSLYIQNSGVGNLLWAMGANDYGQLGDGTTTNRLSPVQVPNGSNVVAIAAGRWHSLFVRADGTL